MNTFNPNIRQIVDSRSLPDRPLQYYTEGIIEHRNHYILSEAITLLESRMEKHRRLATDLLIAAHPYAGKSRRISVTGSPGVGKSTFINSLVKKMTGTGDESAVLTVDPTSQFGGGSILGDKTRMADLAGNPSIFIRPSPASRHLGGVNRHTYEAIILCEAAGKQNIFLETVGIGQSETEVYDLTDCSILLLNPAGGDDIQGIKKGILEIADIAVVHKADGAHLPLAKSSRASYAMVSKSWTSHSKGWDTPVLMYSSLTGEGWEDLSSVIEKFFNWAAQDKYLEKKRLHSESIWLTKALTHHLTERISDQINHHPDLITARKNIGEKQLSPFQAFRDLASSFNLHIHTE